ncbi:5-formyltetrahydrofolate cyclo-ligase [Sinomonas sp. RB5]
MDTAELKSSLRARIWSARRALAPAEVAAAAPLIAGHGLAWARRTVAPGAVLTAYLGVGVEPPTAGLVRDLHEAGFRIMLPICLPERQLGWTEWHPGIEFARSRYAPVQEPVGTVVPAEQVLAGGPDRPPVAGIVLPATALDSEGRRLGQGGGYYDRFLALAAALGARLPTAAVVYDGEVLASGEVPADALDRRVDAALTPGGIVDLGGAGQTTE